MILKCGLILDLNVIVKSIKKILTKTQHAECSNTKSISGNSVTLIIAHKFSRPLVEFY